MIPRTIPRVIRRVLVACLALLLSACSSVGPDAYRDEKPALDLFRYFNGQVDGWGMFTDRSDKVVKRFTVLIRGSVDGDTLTLNEDFSYSDGSKSKRVWTITRQDANRYTGVAADVIGSARGESRGNALRWTYVLALEVDGTTYHVDFDDWMFLQDENVMLNRSRMSKFGFGLGELTLAFRRRP